MKKSKEALFREVTERLRDYFKNKKGLAEGPMSEGHKRDLDLYVSLAREFPRPPGDKVEMMRLQVFIDQRLEGVMDECGWDNDRFRSIKKAAIRKAKAKQPLDDLEARVYELWDAVEKLEVLKEMGRPD